MLDIKEYLENETNDLNELTDEDYKHSINALVDDENEAISGYDRVIQLFENSEYEDKEEVIKVLKEIKKDEYEHIEKLKALAPYDIEEESFDNVLSEINKGE